MNDVERFEEAAKELETLDCVGPLHDWFQKYTNGSEGDLPLIRLARAAIKEARLQGIREAADWLEMNVPDGSTTEIFAYDMRKHFGIDAKESK